MPLNIMEVTLEQMIVTGIHLGHLKQFWNPKMAGYIYGVRNGSHVINLVVTRIQLWLALQFLTRASREGSHVLFVGSEQHTKQFAKERAIISQSFFVKKRWLGGSLTNLSTIQMSLLQLRRLEQDKKAGAWVNLTTKNTILLQKKLNRKKNAILVRSTPLQGLPSKSTMNNGNRQSR